MAEVTLTAAVRNVLIQNKNTKDLASQTSSRLSTGLKIASAIDDAVAFFSSKALSDRARDFTDRKYAIDQAVSSLNAANDGIEAIDEIVRQMKGIAQSLKSANDTQFNQLITDFNGLRKQVDYLASDVIV